MASKDSPTAQPQPRKAINLPYESPKSIFELFTRGIDRYKQNYDKAFGK